MMSSRKFTPKKLQYDGDDAESANKENVDVSEDLDESGRSLPTVSTPVPEDSYECVGEKAESDFHVSVDGDSVSPALSANHFLRRNTWLRTSLRTKPPNSTEESPVQNHKRCGSLRIGGNRKRSPGNYLTTYRNSGSLNRSSSFNSSGRGSGGSGCDGEEPYSDVSLEEDVIDLNHKVSLLQEQITALADNQNTTDDQYQRVKHENSTLNSRIQMLEEQLRELEMRGEDQLVSEQKRCRDLVARIEREKQLELENYQVKLQSMEQKGSSMERELERLQHQADLLKQEKARAVAERDEAESALQCLQSEHQSLRDLYRKQLEQFSNEKQLTNEVLQEMSRELESLRSEKEAMSYMSTGGQRRGASPTSGSGISCSDDEECADGKRRRRRRKRRNDRRSDVGAAGGGNNAHLHSETTSSRLRDLEDELRRLREENKLLVEQKEELQAQLLSSGLDQGRELLNQSVLGGAASLAMELEELSTDEMKEALKEQKEVNVRLRAYIDGILLNIVEHYPQLLEIKTPSTP